ncbi:NB-ARC domain-containing protein [Nostoc sp. UHCC 0870]|uniref:NB-ARC domain-containing protein n=1 Tax=Nostoc sp. UHCC 0870 TaxID=2914041 RepID=UPI001EDFB44F|nr:NB-ARC domain-containing protein [Nostoc sp. UHCC 0870]UKO95880.1 NB-ARC domain-containing protein [Nostoc sp. UHCC 0870]
MNVEEVIKTIDNVLLNNTGQHLRDVETTILRGAWQAKTYEQIAETCQYSLGYIKQVAAPKLWKLLSEALEEDISKTNFRFMIERLWGGIPEKVIYSSELINPLSQASINKIEERQSHSSSDGVVPSVADHLTSPQTKPQLYWGEVPEIGIFYGRTQELSTLKEWLINDRCRLLAVVGMGGIGKTTLAAHCTQQTQHEFESVVWRDLRKDPSVSQLLAELTQLISPQLNNYVIAEDIDAQISNFIGLLRQHRCLIVLDTTTGIQQISHFSGHYREGYQSYGKLLRRLGQESHRSCLMWIAREKPREIVLMEGENSPVRSLSLKGLDSQAKEIFREKKLLDQDSWDDLIQLYRGNPLALKIVANTIQELFGGKVSAFLKQETIVFGELNDILDEQFEYISALEQEILYWLAIECQPISLYQLRADILAPVAQAELIEAIESLLRRSLIERTVVEEDVVFSLQQPVISQYVINQICEHICTEIQEFARHQKIEKIELLRILALVKKRQTDVVIQEMQVRLILKPIKNQLCKILKDENLIEEHLTKILSVLHGKTPLVVGYAKSNIESLLLELKLDLTNISYR